MMLLYVPSLLIACSILVGSETLAFQPLSTQHPTTTPPQLHAAASSTDVSRRDWFLTGAITAAGVVSAVSLIPPTPVHAVGPVKINLLNPTYRARPCPKDKPIPGEKAMKGMKGLCVMVDVELEESPEKPLELVGVYGFITDQETGESVLANNPDLSTDAGR